MHNYLGKWGGRHLESTSRSPRCLPGFRYLHRVRLHATVAGTLALKVHWYQLEDADLVESILDVFPGGIEPKFVYLNRLDKINQAISTVIADATRVYYVRPGGRRVTSPWFKDGQVSEPRFDRDEIETIVKRLIEHDQLWRRFFAVNRISYKAVSYEDLQQDYAGTMRNVMRFLGAAGSTPIPPPQILRQYGEINRAFRARYLASQPHDEIGVGSSWLRVEP